MAVEGEGKIHLYFLLGVLAVVWGIINYLQSIGWTSYGAWIAGGVLLIIVGWLKKNYLHK